MSNFQVSFVVAVMNEQETIRTLTAEINRVCDQESISRQIIFIDDGSTDDSWKIMQELVDEDANIQAIKFRRNFGKAAALAAGFEAAEGQLVITMDGDLQDDPNEIPRFLQKINDGFDVVSGWKKVRHDPWHKVLPSRVFNFLVSWLTGVKLHDHNCGFKCYRREIFDEVKLYGEHHRFVPVLASAYGWKAAEIEVTHHPREFGVSKYGTKRLVKGFLDLLSIYFLTSFGKRPLHLVGAIGLICFALGGIGIVYLTCMWFATQVFDLGEPVHLHQRALFYYCILAILLGAQLVLTGLITEMIVAVSRKSNSPFSIETRVTHGSGDSNESGQ